MYVKIKDNDSVWITTKSVQKMQLFNMHAGVIIEGLNDIHGNDTSSFVYSCFDLLSDLNFIREGEINCRMNAF